MIHEEICTYEVSLLAKEKGFPQWFNYDHFKFKWDYYNYKGELNGDIGDILKLRIKHKPVPEEMKPIAAPTQSLLQRWLREEKQIIITIGYAPYEEGDWVWKIYHQCKLRSLKVQHGVYNSYEEALEYALKYALENLVWYVFIF